ncbi:YicC family protein [Lysinibacillus sp. 2017]|uniref:YicC/YloC family endoribonuclease n=1 Tax=unclassified Lysinibacillus TaxID=2636778 RepID=UPI000D52702A|nr:MULTISPECIES: YicC/YloC family endoribonuclease [unclassified Lysinibacillus]AWE06619.1 YicC family protein [Lysinibacillus sp. 2017]TGN35344.1 YicC family protein [Lysinibacillus sp. S2017]
MVRSMTGFGRGVTTTKNFQLTVEIRAVNHRFLEINTKFPKDWMESEIIAKKMLSDAVSRGKIDVIIFLKELHEAQQSIRIDWTLLNAFIQAKNELTQSVQMEEKWTMQEIVSLDQVLLIEKVEFLQEEILEAVKSALSEAIYNLVNMREREGQELRHVMLQYKFELEQQIIQIRKEAPQAVTKYRERLIGRLNEIASGQELEDRLLTEVAIFAERIDITEELDRLESHFGQLSETLTETIAIGRKLDFIMQEMNREINTIGSKNQSAACSIAVVQAKTILEKMREQVQNIE